MIPILTVDPYPYQDEAIDRGLDRGNLLIAYGMGLGKTLVQLAICEELLGDNEVTLNAIVVPSSLKWQWASAIAWATDVQTREIVLKPRSKTPQRLTIPAKHHAVVIDGTPEKRDDQYRYIREYRPDYVIMGYDNVANDWRYVKAMRPELIALDEATAIKSFDSERSKKIKAWHADWRFALTGTPIDNRPEELFSIMEWVSPGELGRFDTFDPTYISRDSNGKARRYKNLPALHAKTKVFAVRKTRFDPEVAPYMPKDFSKRFDVEMNGKTRKLYKEIAKELIEALGEIAGFSGFDVASYYSGERLGGGSAEQGNAMAKFGALAMLCDHPLLLLESAQRFERWMDECNAIEDPELGVPPSYGSSYAFELLADGRLDWIDSKTKSPKFEAALEEIRDILDERVENKVILFSFNKLMLRLFRDALGPQAVIFDGDMNSSEKEQAKQKFKTDPKTRVFLSSDAGGMGVDLPEANYLCVESSMPILTADLRWVPAESLTPGDRIIGCDEEATPGKGNGRNWRVGTVLNNQTQIREAVDVSLTNDETLTVTPEHRMLVWDRHGTRRWIEAQNLRPGMRISKYFDTWTSLNSFDAGWLSGMLDGEGCVQTTDHGLVVSVAQKEGPILERAQSLIEEAGFRVVRDKRPSGVSVLRVLGNKAEQAKFLGTFLPGRLIRKWQGVIERFTIRANEHPEVKYVTQVGKRSVSVLETDIRTYVGDGYIHHNCNYNHPWSAGKADQRNSRHIRAGSKWDEVWVLNYVVTDSVEDWKFQVLEHKRAVGSAIMDGARTERDGSLSFDAGSLLAFLESNSP